MRYSISFTKDELEWILQALATEMGHRTGGDEESVAEIELIRKRVTRKLSLIMTGKLGGCDNGTR